MDHIASDQRWKDDFKLSSTQCAVPKVLRRMEQLTGGPFTACLANLSGLEKMCVTLPHLDIVVTANFGKRGGIGLSKELRERVRHKSVGRTAIG